MAARISHLRQEYEGPTLRTEDTHPDPIIQFERWFAEARAQEDVEPNAMTLATASADGQPSARIVLLKGIEDGGFVFYTNYASTKGEHLTENPQAALVFWWPNLARQVRVEGDVVHVDAAISTAYFQSRPRGSQLGAWASAQSQPVADRDALETAYKAATERFADSDPLPRPPQWGGYRLMPTRVEFWQGRQSRLHDRVLYQRTDANTWERTRLAP